jgi:hypothetical protein
MGRGNGTRRKRIIVVLFHPQQIKVAKREKWKKGLSHLERLKICKAVTVLLLFS